MDKTPQGPEAAALELMAMRRFFEAASMLLEDNKPHYAVDELYQASQSIRDSGGMGSATKVDQLAYRIETGKIDNKKAKKIIDAQIVPQIDQFLQMIFVATGGRHGGGLFF